MGGRGGLASGIGGVKCKTVQWLSSQACSGAGVEVETVAARLEVYTCNQEHVRDCEHPESRLLPSQKPEVELEKKEETQ